MARGRGFRWSQRAAIAKGGQNFPKGGFRHRFSEYSVGLEAIEKAIGVRGRYELRAGERQQKVAKVGVSSCSGWLPKGESSQVGHRAPERFLRLDSGQQPAGHDTSRTAQNRAHLISHMDGDIWSCVLINYLIFGAI